MPETDEKPYFDQLVDKMPDAPRAERVSIAALTRAFHHNMESLLKTLVDEQAMEQLAPEERHAVVMAIKDHFSVFLAMIWNKGVSIEKHLDCYDLYREQIQKAGGFSKYEVCDMRGVDPAREETYLAVAKGIVVEAIAQARRGKRRREKRER
ncbi:MAG: hypothetical protein WCS85_05600 [Candidatus Peribacteraceae bacterium]